MQNLSCYLLPEDFLILEGKLGPSLGWRVSSWYTRLPFRKCDWSNFNRTETWIHSKGFKECIITQHRHMEDTHIKQTHTYKHALAHKMVIFSSCRYLDVGWNFLSFPDSNLAVWDNNWCRHIFHSCRAQLAQSGFPKIKTMTSISRIGDSL